jgi:hypothetical protein
MNELLHNFSSFEKEDFPASATRFIVLAALLFCTNAKIEAVPVFETGIEFELPCFGNSAAVANSFMNDSILYRYPWWVSTSVRDASNVEWIPAQEFRYSAIEKVLYNFLGGTYEPGSIGRPFHRNLRYIPVPIEEPQDAESTEVSAYFNKTPYPGDMAAGGKSPGAGFLNRSIYTNQQEAARFNIHAVPEPSSILIFSIMSFGYLWMKNRSS